METGSANLTFRPARAQDKERVLEITARTWGDDGDYIQRVWDKWLADPEGEFTVAEQDGIVVALIKLTWLGEGQWWLEGLRVAPELRLQGIGRAAVMRQVERARQLGGRVVRYATGIRNDGSHRIAERAGFHTLMRLVERVAEKLDSPIEAQVLTSADLDAVWEIARDSDLIRETQDMYVSVGWKAFEVTHERLAGHLDKGQAMGIRDETGRVCAWCLFESRPEWERLVATTMNGATEGITTLARALRAHAAICGVQMAEVLTPPHPRALAALAAAGYHIELDPEHPEDTREHGMDVFELRLDGA